MRTVLVLCVCIGIAAAFDCFGRNNSCVESHTRCDTGYAPFCEHFPGPMEWRVGVCTCDKECSSASDCANLGADGCPEWAHPVCDLMHKVCHCNSHPSPPPHHDKNNKW